MIAPLRSVGLAVALTAGGVLPAAAEDPPVVPFETGASLLGGFNQPLEPQITGRERLVVEVLPGTGVCHGGGLDFIGFPCPILRLPDGTERSARVINFSRPGPLTIEVDRLSYDHWGGGDAIPIFFEYVGETEYRIWSPEEWADCPDGRCTPPPPRPVHPAYSIPYPEVVSRDFIDVELVSDQGVCVYLTLPEDVEFDCHEVRLPNGEIIALDIGPHERFGIGSRLYMGRITYASAHPLFDYDRFEFIAYARPGD